MPVTVPVAVAAAPDTASRVSARDRLLAAATELFYEEGVHSVGIDRVIERAGVAKASLYNCFGSKDELVRAYLLQRHQIIQSRMERELVARFSTPRERLIGVFEIQADSTARPGYRGCAFLGASVESRPGGSVEAATDGFRSWLRELLLGLARDAGATDPENLSRQLALLYDGAGVSAWMDHDPSASQTARAIATALVDAALRS